MSVLGTSLFRYWGERQDADGDPLSWPGGPAGFPFRGNPRTFTRDEYENLSLSFKFRSKTFCLGDEEDSRHYQDVCERIANGYYIMRDRDRQWVHDKGCYRIYLEWLEPGYTALPNATPTPAEGQTNGTLPDDLRSVLGKADSATIFKLAGIIPGTQLEPVRR